MRRDHLPVYRLAKDAVRASDLVGALRRDRGRLEPEPALRISAAASSQTAFRVRRRFYEREVEPDELDVVDAEDARIEDAQGLLQELLAGLVALERDYPDRRHRRARVLLRGMAAASCTWCGTSVEEDDGFRLYEPAGDRRAAFCRLEHVIPWAIQGPHWEAGELDEPPGAELAHRTCARCGRELGDVHVLLVRHRGENRIPDDFCSVDHLLEWAKAGGRWR